MKLLMRVKRDKSLEDINMLVFPFQELVYLNLRLIGKQEYNLASKQSQ